MHLLTKLQAIITDKTHAWAPCNSVTRGKIMRKDLCFNLACSFESHNTHHFLVHMKPAGHRLDASITTSHGAAVTQVKNKEFVLKFPLMKQHLVWELRIMDNHGNLLFYILSNAKGSSHGRHYSTQDRCKGGSPHIRSWLAKNLKSSSAKGPERWFSV